MKLTDIMELSEGMLVNSCVVRIDDISNRYVGKGDYGVYSFQNSTCKDDSGTGKVLFKNRANLMDYKGELVRLTAVQYKGQLKGLAMAKDKEGNLQLVVNKSATIEVVDNKLNTVETIGTVQESDYAAGAGQSSGGSKSSGPAKSNGYNKEIQKSIERQNALKCATTIVASMMQGIVSDVGAVKSIDDIREYATDTVTTMAEGLLKWHKSDSEVEEEVKQTDTQSTEVKEEEEVDF